MPTTPTQPVNPDTVPVEFGAGADTLVLFMSGDAYKADPSFRIFVDGKQLGEDFVVTADHMQNEWQPFVLHGDWASGPHAVVVEFTNDIYGGSPHADTNLYLGAMGYDGVQVPLAQTLAWYLNGQLGAGFVDWG